MEVINHYFELFLMVILGLIAGSFITMASYRLALEDAKVMDLLTAPSSCTKCGHRLRFRNLFPIFSWIFQGGACAFCHVKISIRYPLIEVISAISFAAIYFILGQKMDLKLLIMLLIFVTLFIMIITDLENYFISDLTQVILFILGIFYHFFVTFKGDQSHYLSYYFFSAFTYLIFGIALHFLFKYITNKDGIGIDDIKFFAIAGFIIGIEKFAFFMFLSGIFGVIFGSFWQKIKKDSTFPFAPSLVFSLTVSMLINFDGLLNNLLI